MKLTILSTTALIALAACAQPVTLVCDREAIAWDKWGDVVEMPELCQPPAMSPRPIARPVVHDDNDPRDPLPPSKPPVDDPKEPPHEDPDTPDVPDHPDKPDSPDDSDKPERVMGNNGWGKYKYHAPNARTALHHVQQRSTVECQDYQ